MPVDLINSRRLYGDQLPGGQFTRNLNDATMSQHSGMDMGSLRDLHGMEVSREHAELLQVYLPCWIHDELERTKKWSEFLSKAAEALNLKVWQPSEAGHAARLQRSDEDEVLRVVISEGLAAMPDYEQQVSLLVAGGIPQHLRSTAWPLFLRTTELSAPGYYELLIRTIAGKAASLHSAEMHSWYDMYLSTCKLLRYCAICSDHLLQPVLHTHLQKSSCRVHGIIFSPAFSLQEHHTLLLHACTNQPALRCCPSLCLQRSGPQISPFL